MPVMPTYPLLDPRDRPSAFARLFGALRDALTVVLRRTEPVHASALDSIPRPLTTTQLVDVMTTALVFDHVLPVVLGVVADHAPLYWFETVERSPLGPYPYIQAVLRAHDDAHAWELVAAYLATVDPPETAITASRVELWRVADPLCIGVFPSRMTTGTRVLPFASTASIVTLPPDAR